MDDFNIITDEDRSHVAYGMCVGGSALGGMAIGGLGGGVGVLIGGAVGLGMGLVACPYLKEPIKRKLFSPLAQLTDEELAEALRAVRIERPAVANKREAMALLAAARRELQQGPATHGHA